MPRHPTTSAHVLHGCCGKCQLVICERQRSENRVADRIRMLQHHPLNSHSTPLNPISPFNLFHPQITARSHLSCCATTTIYQLYNGVCRKVRLGGGWWAHIGCRLGLHFASTQRSMQIMAGSQLPSVGQPAFLWAPALSIPARSAALIAAVPAGGGEL